MGQNQAKKNDPIEKWKRHMEKQEEIIHQNKHQYYQQEINKESVWYQQGLDVVNSYEKQELLQAYLSALKQVLIEFRQVNPYQEQSISEFVNASQMQGHKSASLSHLKTTVLRSFSSPQQKDGFNHKGDKGAKGDQRSKMKFTEVLNKTLDHSSSQKQAQLAEFFALINEEISPKESLIEMSIQTWSQIFTEKFRPFCSNDNNGNILKTRQASEFVLNSMKRDINQFIEYLEAILKGIYWRDITTFISKKELPLNQKFRALVLSKLFSHKQIYGMILKILQLRELQCDKGYRENLELLSRVSPKNLKIRDMLHQNDAFPFLKTIQKLRGFINLPNPCDKFPAVASLRDILIQEIDLSSQNINDRQRIEISSDDFILIWQYVIIRAQESEWYLQCEFIYEFLVRDKVYNYPQSDQSEYTFSKLKACCEIVGNMNAEEIKDILSS